MLTRPPTRLCFLNVRKKRAGPTAVDAEKPRESRATRTSLL